MPIYYRTSEDAALAAIVKAALGSQNGFVVKSEPRPPLAAAGSKQAEELRRLIASTDLVALDRACNIVEAEIPTIYRRNEEAVADALTVLIDFLDAVLDIAPPPEEES